MEHWRPDNKNNGTPPHHLTKKKSSTIFEKNIILQGKKRKNTFKNSHMKHCDGTDNNRPLLLNNGKTSMQDSIDRE